MRILVVGSGMYVTGRGTESFGTVLPALAEFSRTDSVELVTVCATSEAGRAVTEDAVARINRRLGTALTCTYAISGEALGGADSTAYDCALVCVPDHLHFEIAAPLLTAGLHVQVVKPLTASVAEARELARIAADAEVHGVVEFHKRLDRQNLAVKSLLEDGALGELAYATVDFSQRIDIPTRLFRAWAHRTNVFQYLGVHYVDLLFFLTGFRPARVMARGRSGILQGLGIEAYDSVHALVVWVDPANPEREFIGQYAVNWIDSQRSSAMSDQRYKLVGARGRLEVNQKHRGLELVSDATGVVHVNPYFSQVVKESDGGNRFVGYGARSIIEFVSDVRDLKKGVTTIQKLSEARPTFSEAMVSTLVLEAVNESLADGGAWKVVE